MLEGNILNYDPGVIPEMFARYGSMISDGLDTQIPFKKGTEVFGIHSYHIGFSDSQGKKIDPTVYMGKCLRPTLCLFVCDALGGDVRQCVEAAVSLELIHNFSLIHDDIQDKDIERRHRETVWHLWGIPKALVSGNALHTVGDMSTSTNGFEINASRHNIGLSKLLTNAYMKMIIGQCEDLSFETKNDVTIEMYLRMIEGKTGALIQSSIMMGALSATKDIDKTQAFEEIGFLLGQAFQIRDDYLGVWGNPTITGKPIGGDIFRKKKTYPVIYGFANASELSKQRLDELYAKTDLSDADVLSIMSILEDTGSEESTLEFIKEISGRAKRNIRKLNFPEWARIELDHLIDFLSARDR